MEIVRSTEDEPNPAPPVLKQYGERRTGTNYVRALIQSNWPRAVVLTYILGDKHSPPVDFERIWCESQESDDSAFDFASRATWAKPGPATHEADLRQRREIRQRAAAIVDAYTGRSMRFVVTVKEPTAWIASLARFEQWSHSGQLASWDMERLVAACRMYNEKYAAWVEFVNGDEERRRFIRFEDLLERPQAVRATLRDLLGCEEGAFTDIEDVVEPTVWDHLPVNRAQASFDKSFYSEKRYLDLFLEEHREAIRSTIDWDLFGHFGYSMS